MSAQRALGIAAAGVLLAAAGGGTLALRRAQEDDAAAQLQQKAEKARDQAQQALKEQLRRLQTRVESAATLPELRAQIGSVDANTLRDGFSTEPWWLPVRREAPITALAISGDGIDLSLGVREADLDASALVKLARDERSTTGLISAKGAPYLAAAAVVDKPGRSVAAVLLLARPLDDDLLAAIAKRTGGAVVVSDGAKALASAGPKEEAARLQTLVGSERQPKKAASAAWTGKPVQLGSSAWVWAYAGGGDAAGNPAPLIALWAVAGLGAIAALFFGLRKKAPEPQYDEGEEGDEQPARAKTGTTGRGRAAGASYPGGPGRTSPKGTRQQTHADTPVSAESDATSQDLPPIAPPSSSQPTNPNQFGRYLLLDRIGEGGMAQVFTAVAHGAEGFRRTFVVKRLLAQHAGRQDLVNMFIDEARIGSALVHSNIIPVFDFGKVGDEYYMATEYILGRDLRKIAERSIEKHGAPPPAQLIVYAVRETLRALDYAHKLSNEDGAPMGLVHRDVSPNNILVSLRGEVKLFDFGIAKAEGRLTQTQVGGVKGNYRFMSSEQAYGNPVDLRSDLCSLGLTMYYALTGESLYEGETLVHILTKAAKGANEEDWAKISRLPDVVRDVIWTAIQCDRDGRYANASEMLTALSGADGMDAAAAAKEMDRLFGDDLRKEQARFQAAGKTGTTDPRQQTRPAATTRG